MRRTTPDCTYVTRNRDRLLAALEQLDAAAVAATLEVFLTPERIARFRGVFAARLDAVTVVMDAPHDPHNGAAVLRSCDAFGLLRLHVVERREGFLASNTVSRGSERWVEAVPYRAASDAIASLRASGHELVATHPAGELLPADLRGIPRLALVLGNEHDGIHEELHAACRRSVRIPMRGFAESLNVSVTAAILLERATESRSGDLGAEEQARLYARALILSVPHAAEILHQKGLRLPAGLEL
jgi:tRNA (guanosine-2'-O-)-methyltransferase